MEMMSQTNNHLRRPRNKRSQTLSFSRRVPRRLNNSLQSSFHPLQTPHVLLLSQHRRSPSPRSLLSTNYFAAPECLSEQMCQKMPKHQPNLSRDQAPSVRLNVLNEILSSGSHPTLSTLSDLEYTHTSHAKILPRLGLHLLDYLSMLSRVNPNFSFLPSSPL
ncbi:hypothetical protein BLNAU_13711 [Blattamonas nauphoetae]|uniref:Uncharacterized protein n=1 Tax=Blattamonas nauphoetae TaxID=2049346 RepID=A0ABQ9XIY1_9EUKA|nr:hypothetical protein BLNAU_18418 [Blattamonas nauphoetae]KAK2951332.1 hypothetical protein BLNAU_13711 [Blattamonas nauphoetae]